MKEQLITDGFALVRSVLSEREVHRLRPAMVRYALQKTEWWTVPYVDPRDVDFLSPRIATILKSIGWWKDGIIGSGAAYVGKWPYEPRRPWHQDWKWWDQPETQLERASHVGALFYVEASNEKVGCTEFIAGSHRNIALHCCEGGIELPRSDAVRVIANAGDMLLFDSRALHSASPNTTWKYRHAFVKWCETDGDEHRRLVQLAQHPLPQT